MKTIPFNLNSFVRVKFTERGLNLIKKDHADYLEAIKKLGYKIPEARSPILNTDADGFTRIQLWDLMNKIGPHMYMGPMPPIEMIIFLEVEE